VLLKGKDARLAATTLATTHTCVVAKHTTNRILEIPKISIQAFEACFNDDVNDSFHFLIGLYFPPTGGSGFSTFFRLVSEMVASDS